MKLIHLACCSFVLSIILDRVLGYSTLCVLDDCVLCHITHFSIVALCFMLFSLIFTLTILNEKKT